MRETKRRPLTVGKMLMVEFLGPMNIEISELANAMGVHGSTLSQIVDDEATLTAPMAMKLAAALGNTPEFWLSIQHAVELWDVGHKAYEREARHVRRIRPRPENKISHRPDSPHGMESMSSEFLEERIRAWREEGVSESFLEAYAEGFAEGFAEGVAKGRAIALLDIAEIRFGEAPSEALRERVLAASEEQLHAWTRGVLEASSMEEAFGAGRYRG